MTDLLLLVSVGLMWGLLGYRAGADDARNNRWPATGVLARTKGVTNFRAFARTKKPRCVRTGASDQREKTS